MKKIFIITVLFFIFFLKFDLSFAQNSATSSTLEHKTDYQLPYSGLLPDNPLYFLKVARDRIVGYLISEPLKKAEFDLLQADKRLSGGILVFNSGKEELSYSTISKGENYFEQAIQKTKEAKKQGIQTSDLLGKLSSSAKKHQEVLKELQKKASLNKQNFANLAKKVEGFEKEVNGLLSK